MVCSTKSAVRKRREMRRWRSRWKRRTGVDDLGGRDVDADDAEVVGEAVADKDAAAVDEVAQLEVDVLERHEAARRRGGVEVARRDAEKRVR